MRILSDFHDYYDGVQSLGQDRGLVYVRHRIEVPEGDRLAYPEPTPPDIADEEWPTRGNAYPIHSRAFWLAVAGAVYRGYELTQRGTATTTYDLRIEHAYSANELTEILSAWEAITNPDHRGRGRWRLGRASRHERSREGWLSAQGTVEIRERLAECGIVTVGALLGRDHFNGWKPYPLVLNPRLADFQFGRVLPTQTVYQEIAMWIGGVLPRRSAMMAAVLDPIRFEEHGFDGKTSFRRGTA